MAESFHVVDTQSMFNRPTQILYLDPLISLESGVTNATNGLNNAEAVLIYNLAENKKLGLSLGHLQEFVIESRTFINSVLGGPATYEFQQNPIYLMYAVEEVDINYAIGTYYSNKKDKITDSGESSAGAFWGFEIGNFQLQADYLFSNSATAASGSIFEGGGQAKGSLIYTLQSTIFYIEYDLGRAKSTTNMLENERYKFEKVRLGLVDSRAKNGNDVFWGAELLSKNIICETKVSSVCNAKINDTKLPIWLGFEFQAVDFLTVRGSIKQSILVNYEKNEISAVEKTYSDTDTTASLGIGIHYKNLVLDGQLSTATTQIVDTSSLLTQVSLTYKY